jgi:hypothetical protein
VKSTVTDVPHTCLKNRQLSLNSSAHSYFETDNSLFYLKKTKFTATLQPVSPMLLAPAQPLYSSLRKLFYTFDYSSPPAG